MRVRIGLVIVLAVLAGIVAFLRLGVDRRGGEKPLFPGFRREAVTRINLSGKERETVMEKHDGQWLVVSEDSFPAEASVVGAMLDHIAGFSRKDIVSSNPEKQSLYQVDSTGIMVTVENPDGAAVASFVIGKMGPDYQSTYVRDAGSNDVILTQGYLPQAFERGNRSWQDKTMYALDPDEFLDISIRRPDETVVLSRDQAGEWFISQPESAACDRNRVSRFVRILGRLRCDDFAGRAPVADSGLDQPDSSVVFTTAAGGERQLMFGSQTGSDRVYAKTTETDIVYLLTSHKVNTLLPRLDELRKREPEIPEGQ